MHAQEYTTSLTCPVCEEDFEVQCSLLVDPGCRYHADGSGTPPSEDFDSGVPATCPRCGVQFGPKTWDELDTKARDAAPDPYEPDEPEPEEREGLEWDADY